MPAERSETPMLSRTNAQGEAMGELRQNTPQWVLDVLEATAKKHGHRHRCDFINAELQKIAMAELHSGRMILRLAGNNPTVLEELGISSVTLAGRTLHQEQS